MKLVTFVPSGGGTPRVGVVKNADRIVDLADAAAHTGSVAPFDCGDMVSLVASGQNGLAFCRKMAEAVTRDVALGEVKLLAPIPHPRKNVFCVGWNYLEHFKEGGNIRTQAKEMPDHPTFFTKVTTAVNGPYDDILLDPQVTRMLDWEVELAVVFGPGGRSIAEADAMQHIFGYTVANDVSAREIQRQHGQQWFKGKSIDGTCPMGPWIVTADEIDPSDLHILCRINGVVKQDSYTRNMYFKLPRLLAELSLGLTIEAGDIFLTGTPEGVGYARTPPEFMQKGDLLETEIEGIGVMRNRIV
jgi:2-keto-4-pentenoate hydratase/2-oxohepta-3-ene-1,7-dioic acid hydratase in catechol pathway